MNFFVTTKQVLIREWTRIVRYPIYSFLMLILPLVSFGFFALIFGGGVPRDIPIGVLDEDRTVLSRKLISMVDASPTPRVMYGVEDMREGETLIREGKIEAVLHIPSGFERDLLRGTQTGVRAYVNGTNISTNGLIGKDVQSAVTTFGAGIRIQTMMKRGVAESEARARAMPIHFDKHVMFNPYTNYEYYLLPSFLPMMLMVFTLMLTVFAIGVELKNGTAGEWMAAAGGRVWPALIGKMIPHTWVMLLMSLGMNVIMYRWVGVPLNGSLAVLIVAGFLFVLAYQSIGILLISVLSNLRLSLSIGGGYSVLAFTFSGLTFPLLAMDAWIRAFSYIFPFTFYTQVFVDQAMRGAPVVDSVARLGMMTVLFILLPLLCVPRLRKIATHEIYWRKM